MAAAIRQVAPHNTLIATGANYSSVRDLLRLEPLADGNVIYNFHFYQPHEFTHQGATWGVPWWRETHSIPYPSTTEGMQALLAEVPDAVDRSDLENNYFLDGWNAQRIKAIIDEAADWARAHRVPLICNEFGVLPSIIPIPSRAPTGSAIRAPRSKPTVSAGRCGITEAASALSPSRTASPRRSMIRS